MSHRLFQESGFSPCRKHDRCLLLCFKARKRLHVATVPKEQIFQIGGILQLTCKLLRQVILPLCRHLSFQMRKYPYRKDRQKSVIFAVIGLCGYSVSYVCSDFATTYSQITTQRESVIFAVNPNGGNFSYNLITL